VSAQVVEALRVLRDTGVDVVTLGQYMRPTKKHMAVSEFVTPAAFEAYQQIAEGMGFLYVASGPMVRSSYRAGEFYLKNVLQGERAQMQQQRQQQQQQQQQQPTEQEAAVVGG
jgi:lipoic acid synthetase